MEKISRTFLPLSFFLILVGVFQYQIIKETMNFNQESFIQSVLNATMDTYPLSVEQILILLKKNAELEGRIPQFVEIVVSSPDVHIRDSIVRLSKNVKDFHWKGLLAEAHEPHVKQVREMYRRTGINWKIEYAAISSKCNPNNMITFYQVCNHASNISWIKNEIGSLSKQHQIQFVGVT